jgi:precorrin-8X/cobalt-precorrin-8 methylmutase
MSHGGVSPLSSAEVDAWPVPGGLLDRLGRRPEEIESRSRAVAAAAAAGGWPEADAALVAACLYAAGDLELVSSVAVGGGPAAAGAAALRAGRPVLADVEMVRAGATRVRVPIAVAVTQTDAAELARRSGCTRAAAGVRLAWDAFGAGGIVVVGNAPTALLAALDLAATFGAPACVIATCPGFTLAAEAKAALVASGLPHLAVQGSRGGSGLATAALNALARQAGDGA